MQIQFDDGYKIKNFGKPYFIAELNTSHFGDVEIAKSMIDEAKSCGCNCVKFQSWNEDSLYSRSYYDKNPIAKRFVKKFSFSKEALSAERTCLFPILEKSNKVTFFIILFSTTLEKKICVR